MKTPTHEQLQKYWTVSLKIFKPTLTRIYNYSYEEAPEIEGNYMVVANHFGSLDPWLLSLSFKRQMYFVAGEMAFRIGFLTWLLNRFWCPLSIRKGKSDVAAMMRMIRYLKKGYNISLFPEGNKSFTGENETITPAIGKLAKVGGAALVTYRFEGMYFTVPRWGKRLRRGKCSGKVVNVYTKEQLAQMTPEEVYQHILEDTKNNDHELQQVNPVAYKGKRRAESIEFVLSMCPTCNAVGSIVSKKHMFHCSKCMSKAEYTVYGGLEGDFKYKTIPDWDAWQTTVLKERIEKAFVEKSTEPFLIDKDLVLTIIDEEHNEKVVASGCLCMYYDKIIIGNKEIPLDDIVEIETAFKHSIVFSTIQNENYQVFSKNFTCSRSYMLAHEIIRNLKN